ncbi:hypothetical protein SAMN02949497_1456 [Methylomagnum ishizawai]|uniref:Uncharacterized protein n=1 Tax=Methylomagnum ishizawai TaxID=1760988 RepID=A0A1Y6CU19_9GAMM|nr:hypothetical protein [Methylomagnum ishizawai]SMF94149.1 hypothetical protein SAMN02949497_1456 [Methylomagnum ishizawai]
MRPKDRLRLRIAQEAARIMAEEGIHDRLPAKQKAAARLGIADARLLPRNEEIDEALEEYHRLYRADVQKPHIARLRRLALEAMRFLQDFAPRLVGGVLEGTAGEFSPVTLHLFPDAPEDVLRKLMDRGIPFEEKTASLPGGGKRTADYPALRFRVDGVEVELALLPPELKARAREKHTPKGDLAAVEALVRADAAEKREGTG